MRILHIAPSLSREYGGPTASLLGYALAAAEAGARVSIAGPRPDSSDEAVFAQSGISELKLFQAFGSGAFSTSPALVRWIGRNAGDYDVIHVHGLFNPISTLSARRALKQGAPVVLRPFGTLSRYTFEYRRKSLKRIYFGLLEARNIREASALHFTTVAEQLEAARLLDAGTRAYVIPPALSIPSAEGNPRDPSAEPSAVLIARIHPVKNIETLLDAWPAVLRSEQRATLTIAGGGPAAYVRRLRSRASALGLDASVSFCGPVAHERKQRLLRAAWAFVLPSHHENFGIAVLEAVAAGVPVVISPQVQLAPLISERRLGVVAEASPAQLASAVVEVFRNPSLRASAAVAGPSVVQEIFAPAVIGQQLMRMYEHAMDRARSTGA